MTGEIDERTDPNFTKGFNLGYWLNTNDDGKKHYQDMMELHVSPAFRETTLYRGLVAGREEAHRQRGLDKTHPILTGDQVADVKRNEDETRKAMQEKFDRLKRREKDKQRD